MSSMRRLMTALFAISLVLVGCGGSDDSGSASSTSASASVSASGEDGGSAGGDDGYGDGGDTSGGGSGAAPGAITISGFAYGDPLTVAAGALITVVNEDPEEHSATAEDGSFDTGLFGQGEQMTFTAPSAAGTYNITCTAHADMAGQLIVTA